MAPAASLHPAQQVLDLADEPVHAVRAGGAERREGDARTAGSTYFPDPGGCTSAGLWRASLSRLSPSHRRAEEAHVVRFIFLWQDVPTDVEAFDRHYREVHIPLANKMPGLRRYSLSRNVTAVRGHPAYCVAELEWDDMEAMKRDMQTPEGRATAGDVEFMKQWSPGVQSMTYELENVRTT
jgi:uncharacterized protein (TIGR02118 family)